MTTKNGTTGLESVAILGWDSLILNPPDSNLTDEDRLKVPGCWHSDGPMLPLEFAHLTEDGRLLLVIDPVYGQSCQVFYTLSGYSSVADTVQHLKSREELGNAPVIHFIRKGEEYVDLVRRSVSAWLDRHHFDAAVWPAMGNNFEAQTGQPFSVGNALKYLESLPEDKHDAGLSYMHKIPEGIATPVRQSLRPLARATASR